MKSYAVGTFLFLSLISVTALAERLAITGSTANIRSGPGNDHDVIWQVQRYYPFEVIKKEGQWIQFRDFENDVGWVHDTLTGKIQTVITSKPQCNIRQGPGTQYDIVFTVEGGVPFKVLDRNGDWLHIEHADGDRGWIHSSLVW
jgi:SH3-like domain-containing protein